MLKKVERLIKFLKETNLPKSIKLDECTEITDVNRFVNSHITAIKKNSGNKYFIPYYKRLVKLYNLLNKPKNH